MMQVLDVVPSLNDSTSISMPGSRFGERQRNGGDIRVFCGVPAAS
jgi:hypothetical protein